MAQVIAGLSVVELGEEGVGQGSVVGFLFVEVGEDALQALRGLGPCEDRHLDVVSDFKKR